MIGQQVGPYIIEAQLGAGGMGAVYRARHAMLGRGAAIKILLPHYAARADIVQRFFNEAKAATSIRHPGIVEIYDFGLMPDGVAFIAMELLHGESLAGRLKRGTPPVATSLLLLRQTCGALGAAHERGIVHRDLKPDNVFIVPDPEVVGGERIKLLDFGIAKLSQESGDGMLSQRTATGAIMGTPTYMAPEQCRGVKVDHRADLYSLGCMLFECLTGTPPFVGEGVGDVLAAHIYQPAPAVESIVAGIAPELARLVAQMLAKDPGERPQSTHELVPRFDAILARPTPAAVPDEASASLADLRRPRSTTLSSAAGPTASASPPVVRSRRRAAFAGALVLASGGVAITVLASGGRERVAARASSPALTDTPDAAGVPARPTFDAAVAAVVDAAAAPPIGVSIGSVPGGAEVSLDGVVLGRTPWSGRLPRVQHDLVFVVRRDRYEDARVTVRGDADVDETVRLVKRAPPAAPRPPTRGTPPPPRSTPSPAPSAPVKVGDDDAVNPYQ